jgi:putative YhdH/YhfP family quinone oxidoreductase
MAIGTAGFTAALSVERLEYLGLKPADGPVIVTGAAGGVGSTAVALLAGRGYRVVASTGSADAHDYLRGLGASEIVDRTETSAESERPMERTRWAGAVDAVGGPTLAYLIRTLNIGASVAASGNAGGATLNTTVFPFILRGVNLLGINSVEMSNERRGELWRRIADDLRPPHLEESISREVSLEQTPDELAKIRRGAGRGRVIVRLGE